MLKSYPPCDHIRRWGLWKVVRLGGLMREGCSWMGLVPSEESQRCFLPLSALYHIWIQWNVRLSASQKTPSPEAARTAILILQWSVTKTRWHSWDSHSRLSDSRVCCLNHVAIQPKTYLQDNLAQINDFVNKVAKVQSAKTCQQLQLRSAWFCFVTFKYMEFHKP